jgi:hypothetical protein
MMVPDRLHLRLHHYRRRRRKRGRQLVCEAFPLLVVHLYYDILSVLIPELHVLVTG